MKKQFIPILTISILLLGLMVGCNSSSNPNDDVSPKNKNIKIYSIKIQSSDIEESTINNSAQVCSTKPLECLPVSTGHSSYNISYCIACEEIQGTIYNPNVALTFINTPPLTNRSETPNFPLSLPCGQGNISKFPVSYEVVFQEPISHHNDDSLKFVVTADTISNPINPQKPIHKIFKFCLNVD